MRGNYDLTFIETSVLAPWFKGGISTLETETLDSLDLTVFNISPNQVDSMLQYLGYKRTDYDSNGWEQDTYYYCKQEGRKDLCLFYSGFYGITELFLMEG